MFLLTLLQKSFAIEESQWMSLVLACQFFINIAIEIENFDLDMRTTFVFMVIYEQYFFVLNHWIDSEETLFSPYELASSIEWKQKLIFGSKFSVTLKSKTSF